VQPHLAVGQNVCFAAVRTLKEAEAAALRAPPNGLSPAPENGEKYVQLFLDRWATQPSRGSPKPQYGYRWLAPSMTNRAFRAGVGTEFTQVHAWPALLVTVRPAATHAEPAPPSDAPVGCASANTVRVAAIQTPSWMGELRRNRKRLTWLIRYAAQDGAKIVVMPECAVHGYMDAAGNRTWRRADEAADGSLAVELVAEPVPGPSTRYFGRLAREFGIFLAVSLVERNDGRFYNSQVLIDPRSEILAHHRKQSLWTPGDGAWANEGDRPVQVVDTPYGRLGLMICHDVHVLPPEIAKKGADIVLYSVGWFGPNPETWFREIFPQRYAAKHRMAFVVSNWSAQPGAKPWPGFGYSCIIDRTGRVLAMASKQRGPRIVRYDLPLPPRCRTSRPAGAPARTP
jgi:predicted amidohydrolase